MLYRLLLTFFICAPVAVFATTKVTILEATNDYAYVGKLKTGADQQILLEESSGTESAPHNVYIPVAGTGSTIANIDYTILSKSKIPSVAATSGYARVDVTVDTDQSGYYLRAMVATSETSSGSSSGWKVVPLYHYSSGGRIDSAVATSGTYQTVVELNSLCNLGSFCSGEDYDEPRLVYFFLSSETLGDGEDGRKPDDFTDGVFFKYYVSDKIPSASPSSIDIKKGDSQIVLSYTGSYSDSKFKGVVSCVAEYADGASPSCAAMSDGEYQNMIGTCDLYNKIFGNSASGEIAIENLTNGYEYTAAIAYLNKYYFASTMVAYAGSCVSPLEIEAPLNENQCYLLTAGFGGHHYVINYFRYIRDRYLAKSFLGRKFIQIYYETAPQYTNYIINTPWLSALIRAGAYTLYFIFHHIVLVLSAMMGGMLLIVIRQKKLFRH